MARKITKFPNGALIGWAGSLVNGAKLVQALYETNGDLNYGAIRACRDVDAIYVWPDGKVYSVETGKCGGCAEVEGPFFAEGSGFVAALAAMKAGADAIRAIEIAAELDTGTALPVVFERLGPLVTPKKRRSRKA
jgi:hypothetical protein